MATTYPVTHHMSASKFRFKLQDYYTLTKPEVNLLIVMTTSAGYYLAHQGPLHWQGLIHTVLGTLLVASGTATLNQYMERKYDADMRRTANRPLPAGRVSAREALCFGVVLSVIGGLYLWLAVNALTALLAISTLLSYLLIYTPLKRRTPLCTMLGAFPGAMPALIGWAGASASLHREAWFLFAVLFLWQFPHFLAIALMYREDYGRAGFRMLPAFDHEGRFTHAEIIGFTIALVTITLLHGSVVSYSLWYLIGMSAAGIFLLYYSLKLARLNSRASAGHLLHASVVYLPMVLAVMMMCKR